MVLEQLWKSSIIADTAVTAHDGDVPRQERRQGWLGEVLLHGTVPRQEWERLGQAKAPSPASHHSLELIPGEEEGIK